MLYPNERGDLRAGRGGLLGRGSFLSRGEELGELGRLGRLGRAQAARGATLSFEHVLLVHGVAELLVHAFAIRQPQFRTGEDRRVGEQRSRGSTVDQSKLIEGPVGNEDIRGERYRESTGRELGFGWRWQNTVVVTADEGENDDRHQQLDGRLK